MRRSVDIKAYSEPRRAGAELVQDRMEEKDLRLFWEQKMQLKRNRGRASEQA